MEYQASKSIYAVEAQYQKERQIVYDLETKHLSFLHLLNQVTQDVLNGLEKDNVKSLYEDLRECRNWLIEFYTQAIETLAALTINTHYVRTLFATGKERLQLPALQ